jgi:hypothetical protein
LDPIVNFSALVAHQKAPYRVASSHWFRLANRYFDKLIHVHFGTIATLYPNLAISGQKNTAVLLASFPMTLIPCV